ncbi:hypothetical protein [Almyronema epifaneia]|uniref:Uncharacterized protein n=1 Tax=Almyronema epifaneia S1 TaxID=2991925 RepID=A0ABW6IA72_9CYAN
MGSYLPQSQIAIANGVSHLKPSQLLAHQGHPHAEDAPHPPSTPQETSANSPPAADPAATSEPAATPSGSSLESTSGSDPSLTAPVAQTSLADGLAFGLGESLLGLLVASPFLLMALRKYLQSRP